MGIGGIRRNLKIPWKMRCLEEYEILKFSHSSRKRAFKESGWMEGRRS